MCSSDLTVMDWRSSDRVLMCLIDGCPPPGSTEPFDDEMLLLFNADECDRAFLLPAGDDPHTAWRLFFDTGSPAPLDLFPHGDGPPVRPLSRYPLVARSSACFHRPPRGRRRSDI